MGISHIFGNTTCSSMSICAIVLKTAYQMECDGEHTWFVRVARTDFMGLDIKVRCRVFPELVPAVRSVFDFLYVCIAAYDQRR